MIYIDQNRFSACVSGEFYKTMSIKIFGVTALELVDESGRKSTVTSGTNGGARAAKGTR